MTKQKDEQRLADDLLYGAVEIGNFISRKPAWVYYQQKNLGLTHVGALLVGSKKRLKKLLTGESEAA
jgi:hypothetical protein